ncbi:Lmf1 [Symbiodinium pilosum]|uniref:Lmf1 protein n=1 Tax=Symbiodinium pilosum TaxID=2952 RepID=A0A812W9Z1_SYMPI|nr:Lmf1 [Symbiodinium pilosum]
MAALVAASLTPLALLRNGRKQGNLDWSTSWWITRDLLIRGMGLCYFCGFMVSAVQHRALWGSLGLMPVTRHRRRPAPIFDLFDELGLGFGDWQLELVSWLGVAFSMHLMLGQKQSLFVPLFLWAAYLSIVNLQAAFTFNYGWEWLTCEVGFLIIFLCPILDTRLGTWTPPSRLVLWLVRWCAFRLLLGAGMSKVGRNSSACWRELSCTETHYFTQPIPNPLSWYMHHLPKSFHKIEVALTFVEQLVLPFAMLVPMRIFRVPAALLEVAFQIGIVGTGNYAWINFIGALPCFAMLDDGFLLGVTPWPWRQKLQQAVQEANERSDVASEPRLTRRTFRRSYLSLRSLVNLVLVMVMVYKSKDPIKELFGPAPWINSYDNWFLMNSQGVFGFINKHRVQVVLKYTHHPVPGGPEAVWKPLDFKCLPGSPDRRPCLMSPYHYRLDWETWIRVTASLEQLWSQKAPADAYHQHLPEFLQVLVIKILNGDDDAAGLLGVPMQELFQDGLPPTAISIDFASYTFTTRDNHTKWWRVKAVGPDSLRAYGQGSAPKLREDEVRKSPRWRHWILGISIVSSVLLLELGALQGVASGWNLLLASAAFLLIFVVVLASDYPPAFTALCASLPLQQLLVISVPDVASSQRLAYALASGMSLSAAGINVGLSWHRRHARLAALVLLVVAWISTRIDVPALT